MSYIPITYWQTRQAPNSKIEVPHIVEDYIQTHLKGDVILDYGTGIGRMLYLYEGVKTVIGMDIVDTYTERAQKEAQKYDFNYIHTIGDIRDFGGVMFDCAVVSKVLLHILPENISDIIESLLQVSGSVIVWDAVGQGAPHVFDHDYSRFGTMKDIKQWDNQLLFYYED